MRTVFADTHYWIALAVPTDQWHDRAAAVSKTLGEVRFVTTDEVLVEFLNFLSRYGEDVRTTGVKMVKAILADPNTLVIPQTRDSFLQGLKLYGERGDKQYSLTDCISLCVMAKNGVVEILTHDHHFAQEGNTILL